MNICGMKESAKIHHCMYFHKKEMLARLILRLLMLSSETDDYPGRDLVPDTNKELGLSLSLIHII